MEADVESSETERHTLRQAGQAYFDSVLAKSQLGQDPFQQSPLKSRTAAVPPESEGPQHKSDGAAADDHRAFGFWLESNKQLLLAGLYVLSTACSWVLMKGALISMHTPAVLTFLHLLAALLMQLALVSNNFIPPPHISTAAAKGALIPATLNTLQVLLLAGVLLHSSVYMVLCWVTVVPLLLELSRVADVSSKTAWRAIPQQQQLPLAAAVAGLVLELLADTHRGFAPLLLLLLWCGVLGLQLLWRQIKVDATLGHRLMDPDFLFRARQLSDHEDALTPSTAAILSAALPAGPVLILGLICLEGKDLVDHEPSVPTLSVVLLSCLSYAGAVNIQTMLADSFAGCPELSNLLTAAAALLAIALDFMERAHALGLWCLLGVVMAVSGSLAFQLLHWKSLRKPSQHSS